MCARKPKDRFALAAMVRSRKRSGAAAESPVRTCGQPQKSGARRQALPSEPPRYVGAQTKPNIQGLSRGPSPLRVLLVLFPQGKRRPPAEVLYLYSVGKKRRVAGGRATGGRKNFYEISQTSNLYPVISPNWADIWQNQGKSC